MKFEHMKPQQRANMIGREAERLEALRKRYNDGYGRLQLLIKLDRLLKTREGKKEK